MNEHKVPILSNITCVFNASRRSIALPVLKSKVRSNFIVSMGECCDVHRQYKGLQIEQLIDAALKPGILPLSGYQVTKFLDVIY